MCVSKVKQGLREGSEWSVRFEVEDRRNRTVVVYKDPRMYLRPF